MLIQNGLVYLTAYGLFKVKTWFICKCLMMITLYFQYSTVIILFKWTFFYLPTIIICTGWPKKTEPIYFWLKFINIILAFSFFQDMKYILCMKNWDHSIQQHVLVYQGKELELFWFIFVEVIKKFMGSVFFFLVHPVIWFQMLLSIINYLHSYIVSINYSYLIISLFTQL